MGRSDVDVSVRAAAVLLLAAAAAHTTRATEPALAPSKPPLYADQNAQDEYLGRFANAWRDLKARWRDQPDSIAQLEMVHPTISDGDTVRVWYLLGSGATTGSEKPVIEWSPAGVSDWTTVPAERITMTDVGGTTHATRTVEMHTDVFGRTGQLRLRLRGGGLVRTHEVEMRRPHARGNPEPFSFLVSSCFLPWQTSDRGLSLDQPTSNVLAHLAARASAPPKYRPAFHLQLGDQIYTDGGAERTGNKNHAAYLRGSGSTEVQGPEGGVAAAFDALYRYNFGLRPLDRALSSIPTAMMIDDHEIRDGWGAMKDRDSGWESFYDTGRDAFRAFQASRNPRPSTMGAGGFDFSFDWGAAHFFAADTRSRAGCPDDDERIKICGEQLARLEGWLARIAEDHADAPALLVVSFAVPLTPTETWITVAGAASPSPNADDAADRFKREESTALQTRFRDHLRQHHKHTLLVLSGDVHYSALRTLRLDGRVRGYEVISSGLAQQHFNVVGPALATATTSDVFDVTSHGFVPLPSFTEVFVTYKPDSAPEVKVLLYPGEQMKDAVVLIDGTPAGLPTEAASGPSGDAQTEDLTRLPSALRWSRPLDLLPALAHADQLSGCAVKPEWLPVSGSADLGKELSRLHEHLNDLWGVPYGLLTSAASARAQSCVPRETPHRVAD